MRHFMILLFIGILAAAGCDKEGAAPGPVEPEPASTTGEDDPAAAENLPESVANLTDEQWCGVAHDETLKLVEGIKASMKANAQDESEFAPPARDAYLAQCQKLPPAMQKCLVISYSAANQDACLAAEERLTPPERAVYKELMGK